MAPSTIRSRQSPHPSAGQQERQEAQLAALRALAADLSGDRRRFQRESMKPRLMAQLLLESPHPGPIPVVLIDLGSGGARAVARAGTRLPIGSVGRLLTGGAHGREGERQVRVLWSRPLQGGQVLGLAFASPGQRHGPQRHQITQNANPAFT